MNYDLKEFKKIVKLTYQQIRKEFQPYHTNCMRVYDKNLSTYPVTVDVYGSYVKIQNFGNRDLDTGAICDAVSRVLYIPARRVFYQERKKREGLEQHTIQDAANESRIGTIEVEESGLKFLVDLQTRIDTGLFLDHMPTRVMVREQAFGTRVLNLFAYTGSFSVYAAAGGAQRVVTVDLSNTYLSWAEKHLEINGFTGELYPCVRSDVKEYLKVQAPEDGPFDIIILDPPSFSNSNHSSGNFKVQRDYIWYIQQCMKHLSREGFLVFSTNLTDFHFDSGRLPRTVCTNLTRTTLPPGFSTKRRAHSCWVIKHA
ncbi:MAG: class I SAM-dependent methyltransferase [Spirochaetia bacterium]|nr:class I SAM-dependent methyltransferase [Spirochaetia bacterium]MCF7940398.1 class I SAM-dependent methyltransferase [Spirochaetia bacterium]